MASIQSKLFTILLRLIQKKQFLKRQLAAGATNAFTSPEPPSQLSKVCQVEKWLMNGRNVFTLRPCHSPSPKHILYLHGGAYVQSFLRPHWSFMAKLIEGTHCTITAPDYPFAPQYTYTDAFAMVTKVYQELAGRGKEAEIILMGDSAGGGFALALAQYLRKESIVQPRQIILLSPWLDITLRNPEIKSLDAHDPFLGIEGLLQAGKAYAGQTSPDHYLLSPIYGSLQGLGKITVFAGSHEIMAADTRKLKTLAESAGTDLIYMEYPAMVHTWMLLNFPESKRARQQIIQVVKTGNV
ncbi:alpha/beta hydrolase fold domain-containing protein [Larkinella insperata]|uniref:Alpha/beta hydrolase fold domain-containing protein n=1 Tax=Larkinella insperata TaxID=332158 RepID=A0ABW3QHD1_9BACT